MVPSSTGKRGRTREVFFFKSRKNKITRKSWKSQSILGQSRKIVSENKEQNFYMASMKIMVSAHIFPKRLTFEKPLKIKPFV